MKNLRSRIRDWLGINRQQRTITELAQEVEELREKLREQEFTAVGAEVRHDALQAEVTMTGELVLTTKRQLGPVWTTAEGYSSPMAFLSTGHLSNILHGGFGSDSVRAFARKEIERRTVDADWRSREAADERAPTKEEMRRVWNETETGRTSRKVLNDFGYGHKNWQPIDYAELETRMFANIILNAMGLKS